MKLCVLFRNPVFFPSLLPSTFRSLSLPFVPSISLSFPLSPSPLHLALLPSICSSSPPHLSFLTPSPSPFFLSPSPFFPSPSPSLCHPFFHVIAAVRDNNTPEEQTVFRNLWRTSGVDYLFWSINVLIIIF